MKEHILAILCILLLSSVTQLCAQNTSLKTDHYERSKKNKTLTKRTRYLMGTYVNVSLPGQYISTISTVFDLIQNIENSLSTYAPNATLARLNRVHSVHSDPYLKESILLSQDFYNETGGYFDITIGSITKNLYHFGEQESGIPTRQQLKEAYLNIQGIHMDGSTIKSDRNITIDLGGMGKGYAVDKAADYLKKQNINEGVIALSGDIRCLHLCSLYLQSPYSEEAMFAMVRAKKLNLSISTSGTYRRYAGTTKDHHLINPKTNTQGRDFVSVSLFSIANNTKIDAYATALSVMPRKEAIEFLKRHEEIGFILIDSEGKILYGNLDKLLQILFLDYSESVTIPSITPKTIKKNSRESNLIHPDTTNPVKIIP